MSASASEMYRQRLADRTSSSTVATADLSCGCSSLRFLWPRPRARGVFLLLTGVSTFYFQNFESYTFYFQNIEKKGLRGAIGMSRTGLASASALATASPARLLCACARAHASTTHSACTHHACSSLAVEAHASHTNITLARQKLDVMLEALAIC